MIESNSSRLDDAVISVCGRYRYRLTRNLSGSLLDSDFNEGDHVVYWIMLNPSTADAKTNDPTIRKVLGFSKLLGARVVEVYNLFALRETNPMLLFRREDPVGDNQEYLMHIPYNRRVIAAWGDAGLMAAQALGRGSALRVYEGQLDAVRKMLRARRAFCLGRTKAGNPRHPVRLAYSTPLELYS